MTISNQVVIIGTGCSPANAAIWAPLFSQALDKFSIVSPSAIAAFLANVGVETGGLTSLVENLNYRADRLAAVWPSRYAVPLTTAQQALKPPPARVANALGISLAGNPQALANNVYANRMGNGDPSTGDGWNYRGGGPFQITGRYTYGRCAAAIGIDVVSNPDLIRHADLAAAMSAAWYFVDYGCMAPAIAGNFSKVVQIINGQVPCDANHGPLRTSRYLACKAALTS